MIFRRRDRRARDPEGPVASEGSESASEGKRRRGVRTVIGLQTQFRGTIRGNGPILVHGIVLGEVSISGSLTISPHGRTEADVEARRVEISGQSRGSVRASRRVLLAPTAIFEGDIAAPIMEMQSGSVLRGRASIAGPAHLPRKPTSH